MCGNFETAFLNRGPETSCSSPVNEEMLVKFEEKQICAMGLLLGLCNSLVLCKQKCSMCQRLLNVVYDETESMDVAA